MWFRFFAVQSRTFELFFANYWFCRKSGNDANNRRLEGGGGEGGWTVMLFVGEEGGGDALRTTIDMWPSTYVKIPNFWDNAISEKEKSGEGESRKERKKFKSMKNFDGESRYIKFSISYINTISLSRHEHVCIIRLFRQILLPSLGQWREKYLWKRNLIIKTYG